MMSQTEISAVAAEVVKQLLPVLIREIARPSGSLKPINITCAKPKENSYTALTINKPATKAAILATESNLKSYASRRRITTALLIRILLEGKSAYPHQVREKSKYQAALRKLHIDGYLVQADQQPE